jgi:hypothetical protein
LWFAVVNTANAEVSRWAVDAVPSDWRRWRAKWEFGHGGHFVVTLAGFLALLGAWVPPCASAPRTTGVSLIAPSPSPATVPHGTSLEDTAAREGRSCSDAERPSKADLNEPSLTAGDCS